jgi:hypothetical protein
MNVVIIIIVIYMDIIIDIKTDITYKSWLGGCGEGYSSHPGKDPVDVSSECTNEASGSIQSGGLIIGQIWNSSFVRTLYLQT